MPRRRHLGKSFNGESSSDDEARSPCYLKERKKCTAAKRKTPTKRIKCTPKKHKMKANRQAGRCFLLECKKNLFNIANCLIEFFLFFYFFFFLQKTLRKAVSAVTVTRTAVVVIVTLTAKIINVHQLPIQNSYLFSILR